MDESICDPLCVVCGEDFTCQDGAWFYDGAVLSCCTCRTVHAVHADCEGMHLVAAEE